MQARLMTLLSKRIIVAKSKGVNTGFSLAETSKEDCDSKWAVSLMTTMMMFHIISSINFIVDR
jgi:hypothetical protein